MKAIEGLRAAGATVVFDDSILPDSFAVTVARVGTVPYIREGTEKFLAEYGPAQYHSSAEYEKAVGSPLPATIIGGRRSEGAKGPALRGAGVDSRAIRRPTRISLLRGKGARSLQRRPWTGCISTDTFTRRRRCLRRTRRCRRTARISEGPHSATGWVNMIGVPAVVVPGGFYPGGLPFGLEISARPWKDGDLLGWAYAYEQATQHRKPPVLVEQGLLPNAP